MVSSKQRGGGFASCTRPGTLLLLLARLVVLVGCQLLLSPLKSFGNRHGERNDIW